MGRRRHPFPASRPFHVGTNLLNQLKVIWVVQSPSRKYSASTAAQITLISAAVSSHMRGGSRSSRTRGGMRWTRQRRACDGIAGRIALRERYRARRTNGVFSAFARVRRTGTGSGGAFGRDGSRTAKTCGPDASVLASSWRRFFLARPGSDKILIRRRRWQESRSPGRSRYKP